MPSPKAGYFHDDGSKVPSVTQILNRFKDPGGLFYWACEQGKAIQRGESHLYEKRDQAADAGTLAHGMVVSHIYGKPMPPIDVPADEVLAQASQGFENYLRWERDNRIVVVAQELSMVSQKHRFGGTPDAIGEAR